MPVPVPTQRPVPVRFGVDRVCADVALLGPLARVGLVTNDAARLAADPSRRSRVALLAAGVPVVRLFSPEHGLDAVAADGTAVGDGIDTVTGCPVISLYGDRLRPERHTLSDLDALLFDVPDVGTRFYTYTWTLYHALAACAESSTRLIVLDRPNPLGGELALAEGPILDMRLRSFVGEEAIPIRHQLTLGELARLWQRERFPTADLTIVRCSGWSRDMPWTATGLPWIPTSPSMPTAASALLYPGVCLFEATNVSVARGTASPFMQIGAPWMDADGVRERFAQQEVAGAQLETTSFIPTLGPHAGERCCGVGVLVRDARQLRPVALGLQLLAVVAAAHPTDFEWAPYPTAANPGGGGHLERLVGRSDVAAFLRDTPSRANSSLIREWTDVHDWLPRVAGILSYSSLGRLSNSS